MTKSRQWAVFRCPKAQGALQITFDHAMNSRYSIGTIARKEGQRCCPCGCFVNRYTAEGEPTGPSSELLSDHRWQL